jgi:hydrogenase maturation protein HypF
VERRSITLSGIVQGVGFRAFVHGLASEMGLSGFVRNEGDGVAMEVEGPAETLDRFCRRLTADRPRGSRVDSIESHALTPTESSGFSIRPSR